MNAESDKSVCEVVLGRSTTGTLCGAAAVILAILCLVHILPTTLVSIAIIVLGAGFFFRGAAISCEFSKLVAHLSGGTSDKVQLGGGLSIEILTGVTAVVLGILSLLGLDQTVLLPVAVIALGGGAVMGSGVISRLNALKFEVSGTGCTPHRRICDEIVSAAMGMQILAGIAAIILGILTLTNPTSMTLTFIAVLVLGASTLLTGSSITGKMAGIIHHE